MDAHCADKKLYLESADGLVRSHVEVLDVGVVNGVAHVISNVLATPTFTLWDVVSDIPELSRLKTLITKEFPELRNNLSTHSKRPMTAFLPADTAMDKVMGQVNTMLLNSRDTLVEVSSV
ncbi:uncharacterized protein LOC101850694 [Aplysia californica]|uniref:Uncharacterized protein LOC101850694 n=1 Tax=Aplysia californica TaxID=6500 RepID=A0ABM0JCY3_APLCA|nr:uncharacterized protein LOC101850694 [Aplysia californica]